MAFTRSSNTLYFDQTGTLPVTNIKIKAIFVYTTGANGFVTLQDLTTGADKGTFGKPTSGDTFSFTFLDDTSMVFPNGISVTACTNAKCLLVTEVTNG